MLLEADTVDGVESNNILSGIVSLI
jgi:hypothetical protein